MKTNLLSVNSSVFGPLNSLAAISTALHSLKECGIADPITTEGEALPQLLQRRGGLELNFSPDRFEDITPEQLGALCLETGVPITAIKIYFGENDLDPLDEKDRGRALSRIGVATQWAELLGKSTGVTPLVTGNLGYSTSVPYPRDDGTLRFVALFAMEVGHAWMTEAPTVRFALEALDPKRNYAIQGHGALARVVSDLSPNVGFCINTFAAEMWGDKTSPLKEFDPRRLFQLRISRSPTDQAGWKNWADTAKSVNYTGPICLEGLDPYEGAEHQQFTTASVILNLLQTLREAGFQI